LAGRASAFESWRPVWDARYAGRCSSASSASYPFVPSVGEQQRDNEHELRLKAQIGQDLPVEP
jgi:hypothetical protein